MKISKTSSSYLYNKASQDFVPVACHYDDHTLLTKNGELLQTIQIKGIHAEKISKNLFNLRKVVRESIGSTVDSKKFAFWVHTIRRKANLEDHEHHHIGKFSSYMHNLWTKKNYWHDKFVNRLYITVVHQGPELKLKNFSSWINSLSNKKIAEFEESFFAQASLELNDTVDKILQGVAEYGARRLSIRVGDDKKCYSDPMFLYRRIMQLKEKDCLLPVNDISLALASHQYAVGSDKIEVFTKDEKKFAALLSIKEYQEVSAEALDEFLQIPVEMIATEVFYFVGRDKVVSAFEDQNYILGVSGDSELKTLKGLDVIVDDLQGDVRFCHQQISLMIIGDNVNALDTNLYKASEALSKIGIVHVREDINLEKTFWAQLPANFSFLARMSPTVFRNSAALASLHNFPTGNQHNPWGNAVTLLRTEKGTPYFMNFHDQTLQGTTCIFGEPKSGKTTLLNFLISEAEKYNTTTIYLTNSMDSGLYIKARDGKWFQRDKEIINPFLCEDTQENRKLIFEFFKIISKHYFDPLSEKELDDLKTLTDEVFSLPMPERMLSNIVQNLDDGSKIKERLAVYLPDGKYYKVFERADSLQLEPGGLIAINLQSFDDDAYIKANYPKEKKLIEQFEYELNTMRAVKAAIVLSVQQIMPDFHNGAKIFAVDNLTELMNLQYYSDLFPMLIARMEKRNGIVVSTVNTDILQKLYKDKIPQQWIQDVNTSFILPSSISVAGIDKVLRLEHDELKKLSTFDKSSRMFLIKQDGKTIASELSIGGMPGITRVLCSGPEERKIYQDVTREIKEKNPEYWVEVLCRELESSI